MNLFTEVNLNRLKLGLYGGLLFFSFFTIIAVPVSTNKADVCLLYTEYKKSLGSDSNCNYAVAMAVIFQLLYALFRLITLVLLVLGKLQPDFVLFSDICQLVYTGVDTVAWFLVFISACILSAGINSFCDSFPQDCGNVSGVSQIHTAEAGAWISFLLWLVLMVVGIFWLFRQGKIPFLSRGAPQQTADTGAAPGTAPAPNMDTPPAADDPKY